LFSEQTLVLLVVFLVTLGDHSGLPNVFLVTMILAEGKGYRPDLIFASAFLSIVFYENTLYWLGRWMRTHSVKNVRLLGYVTRSTEAVSRLLSSHGILWLVFGRFVAFVGLYVPFAAGQMGRSYVAFLFWSTCGVLLQLVGVGLPAYLLGKRLEGIVQRTPLGAIPLSIVFALVVFQLVVRYRRARRRRLARLEDEAETSVAMPNSSGQAVNDEPKDHDSDHRREVEADAGSDR